MTLITLFKYFSGLRGQNQKITEKNRKNYRENRKMSAQMISPQILQFYYAQLLQKISTGVTGREILDQNSNGPLRTGLEDGNVTEKVTVNEKKSNFSMASILGEDSIGSKTVSMDSSESDSEQIVPNPSADPGHVHKSPDILQSRLLGYCEPEPFSNMIKTNIGGPHMVPAYPPVSMWGFYGGHTGQQNSTVTKSKRNRTIFTQKQIERLEIEFGKSQYMIGSDRVELAKDLNLSETQVSPFSSRIFRLVYFKLLSYEV